MKVTEREDFRNKGSPLDLISPVLCHRLFFSQFQIGPPSLFIHPPSFSNHSSSRGEHPLSLFLMTHLLSLNLNGLTIRNIFYLYFNEFYMSYIYKIMAPMFHRKMYSNGCESLLRACRIGLSPSGTYHLDLLMHCHLGRMYLSPFHLLLFLLCNFFIPFSLKCRKFLTQK